MGFKEGYKQKMYDARKHYINSIKVMQGCMDCGTKDPEVLSFDHVRGEKLFDICSRWDVSKQKLEEELAKCDVVCHNCHAKRTIQRLKERDLVLPPFIPFPKIPRLTRDCTVTEKIDGTNATVWVDGDGDVWAGSKNRWLTTTDDNYGFAKWVEENADSFKEKGSNVYNGEWAGLGINRGYDLKEKRFYLFNTSRWEDPSERPSCCHVVPVLYQGTFCTVAIQACVTRLKRDGSVAVPGFMNPEGVVIYHVAANRYFKKTIEGDEGHKGQEGTSNA